MNPIIEKLIKANENINSKNMELGEKSLNQTNKIKKLNNENTQSHFTRAFKPFLAI